MRNAFLIDLAWMPFFLFIFSLSLLCGWWWWWCLSVFVGKGGSTAAACSGFDGQTEPECRRGGFCAALGYNWDRGEKFVLYGAAAQIFGEAGANFEEGVSRMSTDHIELCEDFLLGNKFPCEGKATTRVGNLRVVSTNG